MSIIKLTYPDGRIEVNTHSFNIKRNKKYYPESCSTNKPIKHKSFMSTKNYIRLLNNTHKKLWRRDYRGHNYQFLTLTCKKKLTIAKINYEFKKFIIYLTRIYGKIEYVRAIECNYYKDLYHIHTIIQFDIIGLFNDKPILPNSLLEKLWKNGISYIENVYDIYGAIEYITTYKKPTIMQFNSNYTNFPRNAKIISTSQHFGTETPKEKIIKEKISKEQLNELRRNKNNHNFIRENKHYYHDEITHRKVCCIDKVFIHNKNNQP